MNFFHTHTLVHRSEVVKNPQITFLRVTVTRLLVNNQKRNNAAAVPRFKMNPRFLLCSHARAHAQKRLACVVWLTRAHGAPGTTLPAGRTNESLGVFFFYIPPLATCFLRIALISEVEVDAHRFVSEHPRRVAQEGVKARCGSAVVPSESIGRVSCMETLPACASARSKSSPAVQPQSILIISCHGASPLHSPTQRDTPPEVLPPGRARPHFHSSTNQTRLRTILPHNA